MKDIFLNKNVWSGLRWLAQAGIIIQWTNTTIWGRKRTSLLSAVRSWHLRCFIATMYSHLATFWIQERPVDDYNVHFYCDFLALRLIHVCCQGHPTQCKSLCPSSTPNQCLLSRSSFTMQKLMSTIWPCFSHHCLYFSCALYVNR